MEPYIDWTMLRWASILMLAGGILFWIGAFIPPYKQWMTSDINEYLSIVHANHTNWYLIHGPMILGVLVTVLAINVFSNSVAFVGAGGVYSRIAASLFSFGAVLVTINFAFRLTVTMWAADQQAATGELVAWFKTWMDWSNFLFAAYMVLAYLSAAFVGLALRDVAIAPSWLSWTCIVFGFAGTIGYVVRFPLFDPPLMIHTPFMISGVVLLLKMRME